MRYKKTSVLLSNIKDGLVDDKIPLKQIFFSDENNSYFILTITVILSFIPTPFVIPLISNFFGILIIIISFQIMLGKKVKIPQKISNIKIERQTIIIIIEKSNFFFKKIEFLTKHRLLFVFNSETKVRFINFVNFLLSFLIIIPLPVITNIPAFSIMLSVLGLVNKDGLFIFLGFILAILSFVLLFLLYIKSKVMLAKFLAASLVSLAYI
jgi:hypothetical protein